MGNGEHPRPELLLATVEGVQVAEHAEEHLAGDIMGFPGAVQRQVAGHSGREIAIDPRQRPASPGLRSRERCLESLSENEDASDASTRSFASSATQAVRLRNPTVFPPFAGVALSLLVLLKHRTKQGERWHLPPRRLGELRRPCNG